MSSAVLILGAGHLPDRQLGPAPLLHDHPLDLPAGSDLAIQRLINHFRFHAPDRALIAVIDRGSHWHHHCLADQLDQLLEITPQPSAGDSLLEALHQLEGNPNLIINPITALPRTRNLPEQAVVVSPTPQLRENWSAFRHPRPTGVAELLSKLQPGDANEPPSFPFTGLLSGHREHLVRALTSLNPGQRQDLGWLAATLLELGQAATVLAPWHDLGHRATYARSRRDHIVSRSHNRVQYEVDADLIRKNSVDHQRLKAESNYLRNLPPRLQRHFPAVLHSGLETGLELEYIPYPSLAELFLHWRAGASGWTSILHRLERIMDEVAESSPPHQAAPTWLYSDKLRQRLLQLQQKPPVPSWSDFWGRPLTLNGQSLPSPEHCCEFLLKELPEFEHPRPLRRIHGDLCFNNVLADPLHGTVRLIDPRGERATDPTIPLGYGDTRYDLVKLLHSGVYLYDAAVQGFFSLNPDQDVGTSNSWRAQLFPPDNYQMVAKIFTQFSRRRQLTAAEERYLTASLFFSMLPLHGDSVRRQQLLTLIGCCLVTDCFSLLLPCELR